MNARATMIAKRRLPKKTKGTNTKAAAKPVPGTTTSKSKKADAASRAASVKKLGKVNGPKIAKRRSKSETTKSSAKAVKSAKPTKVAPKATTIGINPLDAPVSTAAVIAAILGPIAGARAEKREGAGKRSRGKRSKH